MGCVHACCCPTTDRTFRFLSSGTAYSCYCAACCCLLLPPLLRSQVKLAMTDNMFHSSKHKLTSQLAKLVALHPDAQTRADMGVPNPMPLLLQPPPPAAPVATVIPISLQFSGKTMSLMAPWVDLFAAAKTDDGASAQLPAVLCSERVPRSMLLWQCSPGCGSAGSASATPNMLQHQLHVNSSTPLCPTPFPLCCR